MVSTFSKFALFNIITLIQFCSMESMPCSMILKRLWLTKRRAFLCDAKNEFLSSSWLLSFHLFFSSTCATYLSPPTLIFSTSPGMALWVAYFLALAAGEGKL